MKIACPEHSSLVWDTTAVKVLLLRFVYETTVRLAKRAGLFTDGEFGPQHFVFYVETTNPETESVTRDTIYRGAFREVRKAHSEFRAAEETELRDKILSFLSRLENEGWFVADVAKGLENLAVFPMTFEGTRYREYKILIVKQSSRSGTS